jgi:hypothetical protein
MRISGQEVEEGSVQTRWSMYLLLSTGVLLSSILWRVDEAGLPASRNLFIFLRLMFSSFWDYVVSMDGGLLVTTLGPSLPADCIKGRIRSGLHGHLCPSEGLLTMPHLPCPQDVTCWLLGSYWCCSGFSRIILAPS